MAKSWKDAASAAEKILGSKGAVAGPSPAMIKAGVDLGKAFKEFDTARNALKTKLDAYKDKYESYNGNIYASLIGLKSENFGLDPKDKDDNKKIVAARKVLVDYVSSMEDVHESEQNAVIDLIKSYSTIMAYSEPD